MKGKNTVLRGKKMKTKRFGTSRVLFAKLFLKLFRLFLNNSNAAVVTNFDLPIDGDLSLC